MKDQDDGAVTDEEEDEADAEGGKKGALASADDGSGYKSANDVLHELHTLHRHRFTPSTLCIPHILPSQDLHSTTQHNSLDVASAKLLVPPDPVLPGNVTPVDESLRVRERYEGVNRTLGSLFLSRRRQLGSSESPVATS